VGSTPNGWSTFIGWIFNGNNNSLSSGNYALVDNSKSYNGGNSVHFRGGANPAQIVRSLPAGIQRLHMRAYVNLSKAMGNQAGDNHEHIMGIKRTPDANDEVRVGQIKGVLGTNQSYTDNIAPKMSQWYSGPQLAANTWYCVETAYYADTAYDELRMWVNGTLVHSITSANDWNNGALGADWLSDKFTYAMFGFHSFSGNTADVWMDDIVLSTQPIGCGAVSVSSSSSVASSAPRSSSSVSSVVTSTSASAISSSASSSLGVSSSSAVSSSSRSSVASSANPNAAWDLDGTTSYLSFVTTKNTHNVEVHSFTALGGYIGNDGVAVLNIDLNSVNTNNSVRDQRVRDLLFETTTYPTATVTVTLPSGLLGSLAVGQASPTDISATVSLHGMNVAVTTRVSVQRLSSSRILVQTIAPVLTKAGDFNLTTGLETLRSLVGLTSISAAVPVDFALVFNAR
jgi:polyisoprenoid-binding protein YceI